MKVLNTEIEFNFNDADDMERLENAIDKTTEKLNNIKIEGKRTSEIIRESCKAIFDCFNSAFGEGIDKKVFGLKTNFDTCIEAFQDLCNAKEEQENGLQEKIRHIENKYSPNRVIKRKK